MAIRRRRNTSAPRGQGGGGGAGASALLQTTTWDWLVPGAGVVTSVVFDLNQYNIPGSQTGNVNVLDVIEMSQSGVFTPCTFPVFPRIQIGGLLIKTNIQAFVDYAGVDPAQIPPSLGDTITVFSDKGRYIGCDNGSANISQPDVRVKVDGVKILQITSVSNTEVVLALSINNDAGDIFVGTNNLPFFPYNSQTTQIGGVPFFGETYLNQGEIVVGGIKARYNPGPKVTSGNGGASFGFTLGG